MDVARNKYVQGAGRYVLAFGGLSAMWLGMSWARKSLTRTHAEAQQKMLAERVVRDTLDVLQLDDDYLDVIARLAEFQPADPFNFAELARATAAVITFLCAVRARGKTTMADVMEYSTRGQEVIEAVRQMRSFLELKMPSALDDFDEIAVDVQSKYDEDREHVLFDAQLRW